MDLMSTFSFGFLGVLCVSCFSPYNEHINSVKNEAVLTAHRACPEFLTAFIADMQANIHSVLDIEEMCVSACIQNKRIVNRIFEECGEQVRATKIPKHTAHYLFIFD
jgi:hypothetical protein